MSDGYRNGAFALGLVTGVGLVLNLFVWSAHLANNKSDPPSNPQVHADSSQIIGYWDWFVGTLFNPMDTIAQWIMALLSLVAVILLWLTLKASRQTLFATQKMASDTFEIGQNQVRAHLSVENVAAYYQAGDAMPITWRVNFNIRNSGSTPARLVSARIDVFDKGGKTEGDIQQAFDVPAGGSLYV